MQYDANEYDCHSYRLQFAVVHNIKSRSRDLIQCCTCSTAIKVPINRHFGHIDIPERVDKLLLVNQSDSYADIEAVRQSASPSINECQTDIDAVRQSASPSLNELINQSVRQLLSLSGSQPVHQ